MQAPVQRDRAERRQHDRQEEKAARKQRHADQRPEPIGGEIDADIRESLVPIERIDPMKRWCVDAAGEQPHARIVVGIIEERRELEGGDKDGNQEQEGRNDDARLLPDGNGIRIDRPTRRHGIGNRRLLDRR